MRRKDQQKKQSASGALSYDIYFIEHSDKDRFLNVENVKEITEDVIFI